MPLKNEGYFQREKGLFQTREATFVKGEVKQDNLKNKNTVLSVRVPNTRLQKNARGQIVFDSLSL